LKAKYFICIALIVSSLQFAKAQSSFLPGYFNIKQYGAIGDGKNLDSKAINKTIEAAANNGGGTVLYLPEITYAVLSI
jgi:polygalacturonase